MNNLRGKTKEEAYKEKFDDDVKFIKETLTEELEIEADYDNHDHRDDGCVENCPDTKPGL